MLLKCLVKHYVRTNLGDIKGIFIFNFILLIYFVRSRFKRSDSGPITIVTGKARRVTFVEVRNDINHMIDVAKVVDLVIIFYNNYLTLKWSMIV